MLLSVPVCRAPEAFSTTENSDAFDNFCDVAIVLGMSARRKLCHYKTPVLMCLDMETVILVLLIRCCMDGKVFIVGAIYDISNTLGLPNITIWGIQKFASVG